MTDENKTIDDLDELLVVNIKQAFILLRHLNVKKVILPLSEYHRLEKMLVRHYNDDGGPGNYQRIGRERFHVSFSRIGDESPTMWIYGIYVKHDGITP